MTERPSNEEYEAVLSARRYLYTVFQSLFGSEPTAERLQTIGLPLVREASALLGFDSEGELPSALEQASGDVERAVGEYTYLFVGPNELPAPPWESVYAAKDRTLFNQHTLEVRNFYRSEGLIPQMYPSVADDHVALELDFLRLLANRALDAFESDNRVECAKALGASREFIESHLGTWVDAFAKDLTESKKGSVYPAVGRSLAAFVRADREVLGDLAG